MIESPRLDPPVPDSGERRLLGNRDHDHRGLWRCGASDGVGAVAGIGGDAPVFRHHRHPRWDADRIGGRGITSLAAWM